MIEFSIVATCVPLVVALVGVSRTTREILQRRKEAPVDVARQPIPPAPTRTRTAADPESPTTPLVLIRGKFQEPARSGTLVG